MGRFFTSSAETCSLNGMITRTAGGGGGGESCRMMECATGLLPWNPRIA